MHRWPRFKDGACCREEQYHEGAVAIVLLLSAGGLASLQSMVISTGLPFTVVLLIMCYAIYKGLAAERQKR